jgi:hypothetical protein
MEMNKQGKNSVDAGMVLQTAITPTDPFILPHVFTASPSIPDGSETAPMHDRDTVDVMLQGAARSNTPYAYQIHNRENAGAMPPFVHHGQSWR